MLQLGAREAACRASIWCRAHPSAGRTSSVATVARPRLHLHHQPAEGEAQEPLLVCYPVLERVPEAGSSSSSSNSSMAASSSAPSTAPASPWHVAYWELASQQLPSQQQQQLFSLLNLAVEAERIGTEGREAPPSAHHLGVQLNDVPPPQQQQQPGGDDQKHKDFYANVGDCIRTLREDYPAFFLKDLSYNIYREDMVFKDPHVAFRGLKNYKLVIWSLRFHGKLFFKQPYVEVLRIWQPEEHLIKIRWTVQGCPRLWWTDRSTFDGISTYKLDKNGQIYEHSIDNMQLRDPPITNPLLYGWNFATNPLVPQQTPCPGAYFREESEDALPGAMASAGQQ